MWGSLGENYYIIGVKLEAALPAKTGAVVPEFYSTWTANIINPRMFRWHFATSMRPEPINTLHPPFGNRVRDCFNSLSSIVDTWLALALTSCPDLAEFSAECRDSISPSIMAASRHSWRSLKPFTWSGYWPNISVFSNFFPAGQQGQGLSGDQRPPELRVSSAEAAAATRHDEWQETRCRSEVLEVQRRSSKGKRA